MQATGVWTAQKDGQAGSSGPMNGTLLWSHSTLNQFEENPVSL